MASRHAFIDASGMLVGMALEYPAGRAFPIPASAEICPSPLCPCSELRLVIRPDLPEAAGVPKECAFTLDLDRQSLSKGKTRPEDSGTQTLVKSLVRRMTPYLWSQARGWFTEQKHAQLQAASLSTLKPRFPKDLERDPTLLISYGGIVPHAQPLLFLLEGQTWQAMDDYCVNPHCPCTEVHLTFRPWPAGAPWGPSVHDDALGMGPVVCLELTRPTWTTTLAPRPGEPSLQHLVTALEGAWPGLRPLLQARWKIMKQLASAHLPHLAFPVHVAPVPVSPLPVFPLMPVKVGRNEPCPCGSGKKFKHCCG